MFVQCAVILTASILVTTNHVAENDLCSGPQLVFNSTVFTCICCAVFKSDTNCDSRKKAKVKRGPPKSVCVFRQRIHKGNL